MHLKKEANTAEKFALHEKSYPRWIIFFTVIATMIGPGYSYGAINKFYDYGFLYTIFFLIAVLQLWIFGHFFVGRIKTLGVNARTIGDLIGQAYGKKSQIIAGLLTFAFSTAIVGVISLGGGKVISNILDIPLNISIVAVAAFITGYSMYGGIAAVIRTDKIQFVLICIFLIIGVIAGIYQFNSSTITTASITDFLWPTAAKQMPLNTIFATAIAFFFGEMFLPVYSIRGLISKNKEEAIRGFKNAAYFGVIWFFALTFIGMTAHYFITNNSVDDLYYIDLIKATYKGLGGSFLIGLGIAGMLSVVMSTMDSILNAGGVSFSRDIAEKVLKIDEEQKLGYSRYSIIIIAAFGIFITIFTKDIVGLLLWAYNLWVPTIIFPLGYYLLKGKVKNPLSGFIGMLFGVIGWFTFEIIFKVKFPAIIIGLLLNATSFLIVEYFIKVKDVGDISNN
ncbi:sodium:solute symporter [Bacteroidota bacterium]